MLDTSICVTVIRRRSTELLTRLRRRRIGSVGLSAITLAELQYGVARSCEPERNRISLLHFCAPLEICPFDDRAATAYGPIRAALQGAGTPIGPLDTLIASHALSLGVTLVTANEREFTRVPGLRVEAW